MTEALNLVAIVGSLRVESFNRAVFNTAVNFLEPDVGLSEVSLSDVPFYNGDVEDAGDPVGVAELKRAVDAADGLIVFTPEYNGGVPAVTKNAIDWLSRVPGTSVLSRATVGIVGASPGGHEVPGVRAHLGQSVGANTPRFYETTLGIGSIHTMLDGDRLTGEAGERLAEWLAGFVDYVKEQADA